MKRLILIVSLVLASTSFAQKNKPATAAAPAYNAGPKVLGGNIGFNQSALNIGVTFDSGTDTGDLGGSFFLQTEKEDDGVTKVFQVMTFGAHVNLNVFDQAGWILDLRPGLNISMISDVPSGTGKDDKTVFGPSLRWSVARRTASGLEIGVERLEVWNWFDDDAPVEGSFTTLVFRTRF